MISAIMEKSPCSNLQLIYSPLTLYTKVFPADLTKKKVSVISR